MPVVTVCPGPPKNNLRVPCPGVGYTGSFSAGPVSIIFALLLFFFLLCLMLLMLLWIMLFFVIIALKGEHPKVIGTKKIVMGRGDSQRGQTLRHYK